MILITGFGPYREELNASGELVSTLKDDLPEALVHLREQLALRRRIALTARARS